VPDNDLPLTGVPGKAVLAVIGKAVETRWAAAKDAARGAPGPTVDARVATLTDGYVKQLAALGAAAGGTAAIPGVGTLAALGATGAELAAFTFRFSEMIIAIGAAHGHDDADEERRKAWVLAVLAFGDEAAVGFAQVSANLAAGVTLQAAKGAQTNWFHTVNRYLGRKILARWGARRGAATLGRVLPFGIGAAFGAGTNYVMARAVAKHAHRFFTRLPADLLPVRV
jgi:hypothetical protein